MPHTNEQHGSDNASLAAQADELQAIFQEAFDAEFCCWVKEDAWLPLRANDDTALQDRPPSFDLPTLLDNCLVTGQPAVAKVTDKGHLLALPITLGRSLAGAAVGHVRDADAEVIHRIAKSVLRTLDATHTSRAQREQLDTYARHLGQCFEELAWLRDLTGFIDLCDATSQIAALAAKVLPSLCDVLGAESLALVRVLDDAGTMPDSDDSLEVSCQAGDVTRTDNEYYRTVRCFAGAGKTHIENCVDPRVTLADAKPVQSFISVRVEKDDRLYGWLVAVNKATAASPLSGSSAFRSSEYEFGTFEAGLLESAAVVLATQASNADLFRESKSMFIGVIRALAGAIDAKDPYTCGHSDRVARIAKRLAEELGLDTRECERIYIGGLLHDVGKIGVRDEVLLKPGKLTDGEFDELKKHPEIGFSILDHIQRLQPSLPGVLHHHERIDGEGYPAKLAGADIPLPARIIAVADAYDAMTSCRPYRTAMSTEKAESILRELAGVQWDAQIVEAFFNALPDIHAICADDSETGAALPAIHLFPNDVIAGSLAAYVTTTNEGAAW